MSSAAKTVGSGLGIALVVAAVGWFGFQHYAERKEYRLPLKVKQTLANFKADLPIQVESGLTLTDFDLSRSAIYFTLRFDEEDAGSADNKSLRERLTIASFIWLCQWRERFVAGEDVEVSVRFIDRSNNDILALTNSPSDCAAPLDRPKRTLAS